MRRIRMLYNSFSTLLVYIVGVIVVYSGIAGIESGRLNIGVLVSFLIYIRNLTAPVRNLARIPVQLHANRASAERIMDVFQSEPSVRDDKPDTPLQVTRGEIAFQGVTFAYPDSNRPVFQSLSATIRPAESIALVGPSGAGKSTFASLLLRFHDPQDGIIAIDGTNIKDVSLASLRDQVSIVWQQPFIVNGTIRENLLMARPSATDGQIAAAIEASHCREFIDKLPEGLDSIIGTSGTSLSVGQAQRIAIAQAFLRDTPILILDEASSALDSQSERMVMDALQSLHRNRTTLIIAHRFSSIRNADRILYFNGNGTVTSGTHDSLMNEHEGYQDAVDWQTSRP
jgi:ATP-binding cassette subfamily B protein